MARKQAPIADLKFYTEVATSDRSISWTIEKFPLLLNTTPNGVALTSPKFEIKVTEGDGKQVTTEWLLECYPAGTKGEGAGHVSVYIRLSSLGNLSAKNIRAQCQLGLQDTRLIRKFNQTYDISSSARGYHKFLSHEDLDDHSDVYLVDGKLVIKCQITLHSVVGPRTFVWGPLAEDSIQMRLAAVNASAASRHAWEALKQEHFVDLGPSTVTLVFGEGESAEEELCHTFPLAARSPVLQKMLTEDMLETSGARIEIPNITAATGREMLFYCYTGHVRPTAVVQELLGAADKYEMEELKEYCLQVLGSSVSKSNWTELLLLSELYLSSSPKKQVLEFVGVNKHSLVKDTKWADVLKGHPALLLEIMAAVAEN
jgi:speckle-type POZ protein